ncbi:MAG TPA: hypothetical protein VFB66_06995 [Tepidisphaeraceae bacterium]|nr:hypothetical protein [Tepidisphaeraceae bacterium]
MAHPALSSHPRPRPGRKAGRWLWGLGLSAVVAIVAGAVYVRLFANPFFDATPKGPPPPPHLCPIQLPNGSTPVTILEQPLHGSSYGDRRYRVRFESRLLNGIDRPLPVQMFHDPADVYWYPAFEDEGYLRLAGKEGEVLIDLTRGATLDVTRDQGEMYVAEVGSANHSAAMPGQRVHGVLAESPGIFIGRLERKDGWNHFVPARDDAPR